MKGVSIIFLQAVIILISLVTVALLIWLPLTEGRTANLSLFHIYSDPFVLYSYTGSIAFFITLYKAFKLLDYVRQNKVVTTESVKALRSIKYCTVLIGILIVLAGMYIRFFHNKEDDPAGFLAICTVAAFASVVVAAAAALFEKVLQNAVDMKSENDLTI